ncbi:MAG TPA: nuclease-related domain-containing protein [Fimbriimonas sp.]
MLAVACGSLGVSAATWWISQREGASVYWIVASLSALLFGLRAMSEARPWDKGDDGEWRAVRGLRELSDDYSAIRNWMAPNGKGDVDLIVTGPHGVLVCEIKNYGASYACEGDEWVNVKENGYRKRMKSPSRQLKSNVKNVAAFLRRNGHEVPVQGVLVLRPKCDVKLVAPTVPVVEWNRLEEYVRALPAASGPFDPAVFLPPEGDPGSSTHAA